MSVTIVEGNHPTALGGTMIITRIEPSTNPSESEDRLREQQQQQHHLLVNCMWKFGLLFMGKYQYLIY
jgi:hypothetical protein